MGVVHAKNILKWGGAKNIYTQGQRGSKRNSLFIFGIDGTCDTEKSLLLISIINTPFNFRVFPACLISIKPHTYPFHLPHQKKWYVRNMLIEIWAYLCAVLVCMALAIARYSSWASCWAKYPFPCQVNSLHSADKSNNKLNSSIATCSL